LLVATALWAVPEIANRGKISNGPQGRGYKLIGASALVKVMG